MTNEKEASRKGAKATPYVRHSGQAQSLIVLKACAAMRLLQSTFLQLGRKEYLRKAQEALNKLLAYQNRRSPLVGSHH